jgi:hypothetical protein
MNNNQIKRGNIVIKMLKHQHNSSTYPFVELTLFTFFKKSQYFKRFNLIIMFAFTKRYIHINLIKGLGHLKKHTHGYFD